MNQIKDIFSAEGTLSGSLDNYQPRNEQIELASHINQSINDRNIFIGEAGTGVGKSLAYLIPVFLSNKQAIISTGTKHLQDQLFYKDIPVVKKALGMDNNVAILKGRNNYLCLHRMQMARHHYLIKVAQLGSELHQIEHWSYQTDKGEISEISGIKEDSRIWPLVTSTSDNCVGQDCANWDECFIVKARRLAQAAQIVIVNHHLFLADLSLKEEGFGEVLPTAEVYILDEAHQLPDIAVNFFSLRVSSRQINELCNDTISEQLSEAPERMELRFVCEDIQSKLKNVRLEFGTQNQRKSWAQLMHKPSLKHALNDLIEYLEKLREILKDASEQGKGLENCYQRCTAITNFLNQYTRLEMEKKVLWFETFNQAFVLYATPQDVSGFFSDLTNNAYSSWIFTSATLSVNENFEHFKQRLGIKSDDEIVLNSPFNYKKNAALYIPRDVPAPNSDMFYPELFAKTLKLMRAAKGRSIFLFTSRRAMFAAENYFGQHSEFTVFVQGNGPKMQLIELFQKTENAILLATASFWEGVDIRGQALSCVIIDKLPFASPGDPVLKARLDFIAENDGNPFMDYQVPQAVIALKQGAGRLIRDVNDKGLLMLCDSRLHQKHYGKVFIESLHDMPLTHDQSEAEEFLRAIP